MTGKRKGANNDGRAASGSPNKAVQISKLKETQAKELEKLQEENEFVGAARAQAEAALEFISLSLRAADFAFNLCRGSASRNSAARFFRSAINPAWRDSSSGGSARSRSPLLVHEVDRLDEVECAEKHPARDLLARF